MLTKFIGPKKSTNEHQANFDSMNIVFGATLGFVLADTENFNNFNFIIVLVSTMTVVLCIFYIKAAKFRKLFIFYTAVSIAALPSFVNIFASEMVTLPSKLRITLAVWAAFAILIEFSPRQNEATD